MTSSFKLFALSACLMLLASASAQALTAVRVFEGYKCFRVYIPEEKRFDPTASPPVFAAPTEASQRIGYSGGTAFVKWPLNEVNGFVEIAWGQHGVKAWIQKNVLRPWHTYPNTAGPAGDCVPSVMNDGSIGIGNALPIPK